ncbi:MAG: glycyl-radical enzyme activating protein [Ruminococcaceae bacterium]|nr:glycyl-radical enzyme activating protein [Oscillospiraceae bacterium]
MTSKAVVSSIQRYCLDDGPGIRTTVFLKGCPLRCLWCHNPETHKTVPELLQRSHKCTACGRCVVVCPKQGRQLHLDGDVPYITVDRTQCITCGKCEEACPAQACEICGEEMTVDEVMATVVRDKIFYKSSGGGGMTVSGGECASQPEFTLALLRAAKEKEISRAIETCGFGNAEFFRQAAELDTLFLYDLKEMDNDRHRELTGVSNERIIENLLMLMDMGARIHIRMPLIPGVNDSDEELAALADFLTEHRGKYELCQIMPYHSMGNSKASALGRDGFFVDPELTRNGCVVCRDRWIKAFNDRGIDVEISK